MLRLKWKKVRRDQDDGNIFACWYSKIKSTKFWVGSMALIFLYGRYPAKKKKNLKKGLYDLAHRKHKFYVIRR